MLSYTHAGLYYVYHVVAELLALLDDIHIHRTDGIGIEMVVHIVVSLMTYKGDVHLGEGIVGKLLHLMHVFILRRDEILLATVAAVQGTGNVEAAVTDTLNLRNLTEHGADLSLGLVRQILDNAYNLWVCCPSRHRNFTKKLLQFI